MGETRALLEGRYQDLAAENPVPDLDTWIRDAHLSLFSNQIKLEVQTILDELKAAREALELLFVPRGRNDNLYGAVEAGVVEVPPGKYDWYLSAWGRLDYEYPNQPPLPAGSSGFSTIRATITRLNQPPPALAHPVDRQLLQQLVRDVYEARRKVTALRAQRDQAEQALSRVTKPRGLRAGALVLSYFAFVGAVIPLYLMLFVDVLLDWAPFAVLVGFVSGVAALLGYVWWQVTHLSTGN